MILSHVIPLCTKLDGKKFLQQKFFPKQKGQNKTVQYFPQSLVKNYRTKKICDQVVYLTTNKEIN